jgi:arginine-tRNA-protein transferase
MESVFHYVAPASPCGYLPAQRWRLEYEIVRAIAPAEYMQRLASGWRRFGCALFRPRCPACTACRSLRVDVAHFRPDRAFRRVHKMNEGQVRLEVGEPEVTRAKVDLYDRYHAYQSDAKGWPIHDVHDEESYRHSFVDNPLPTEEWCYYLGTRLIGVGYVDVLPAGLSAIYCFYDPAHRHRSVGSWNILCQIDRAKKLGLPHVYLGYYVAGCRSMLYKARFVPNQLLESDGQWHRFGE